LQARKIKDLRALIVYKKVAKVDGLILKELEGARGGRAWFAGH